MQRIFGPNWRDEVNKVRTSATNKYAKELRNATDVELCSAAFILYGALVIGGGKATQKRVKRVLRKCDHVLFDVSENIIHARQRFKNSFYVLGKKYPEHFDEYVANASRFMKRNNQVVLSIRCLPFWCYNTAIFLVGFCIAFSGLRYLNP